MVVIKVGFGNWMTMVYFFFLEMLYCKLVPPEFKQSVLMLNQFGGCRTWMGVCCTADVCMLPWLSRFEPFAAIGNWVI